MAGNTRSLALLMATNAQPTLRIAVMFCIRARSSKCPSEVGDCVLITIEMAVIIDRSSGP
jgi:hypothetical protein